MTKSDKIKKIRPHMSFREWNNFKGWASDISFVAGQIIYDRTKDALPAYIKKDGDYVFEENDPDFDKNIQRLKRDANWTNKSFSLRYPEKEAYYTTPEYRELKKMSEIYITCEIGEYMIPLYYDKSYKGAVAMFWQYAQEKQKISQDIVDMIQREYEKFCDEAKQAGQQRREQKAALTANLKTIGG